MVVLAALYDDYACSIAEDFAHFLTRPRTTSFLDTLTQALSSTSTSPSSGRSMLMHESSHEPVASSCAVSSRRVRIHRASFLPTTSFESGTINSRSDVRRRVVGAVDPALFCRSVEEDSLASSSAALIQRSTTPLGYRRCLRLTSFFEDESMNCPTCACESCKDKIASAASGIGLECPNVPHHVLASGLAQRKMFW